MTDYEIVVNEKKFRINVLSLEADKAVLEVDGKKIEVGLERPKKPKPVRKKAADKAAPRKPAAPAKTPAAPAGGDKGGIVAPIPGVVLEVLVKAGDEVVAGQEVCKLEAMKMENTISADHPGKVTEVCVEPGDAVGHGQTLIRVA